MDMIPLTSRTRRYHGFDSVELATIRRYHGNYLGVGVGVVGDAGAQLRRLLNDVMLLMLLLYVEIKVWCTS